MPRKSQSESEPEQPTEETQPEQPTEKTKEEQTQEQEEKPKEAPSLQEVAQQNADRSQQLVEEGKTAPDMPATPQNLAKFQNSDKLSEQEKKAFEPKDAEAK